MTRLEKAKSFNISLELRAGLERLTDDRNSCCSIFNLEGFNILKALLNGSRVNNRHGAIDFDTNRVSNFLVEFKVILKKNSFNDEYKKSVKKKSYISYRLKQDKKVALLVNELLDLIAKVIDLDTSRVS